MNPSVTCLIIPSQLINKSAKPSKNSHILRLDIAKNEEKKKKLMDLNNEAWRQFLMPRSIKRQTQLMLRCNKSSIKFIAFLLFIVAF